MLTSPKEKEKIMKIQCKNCKISLSSNKIQSPILQEENSIYIKKFYLKNITFKKERMISQDKAYVFSKAKCLSCNKKLGQLIWLAKPEKKDLISSIKLMEDAIEISFEKEDALDPNLVKEIDSFFSCTELNSNFISVYHLIVKYNIKLFHVTIE